MLHVRQRYRDNTNILDTIFTTATGVALITDFMPVEERTLKQHARLHDNPRLVRIVECLSGRVRLRHVVDPAPDYG
ncbi:MAG: glycoside hydrolase family 15 protein, partial [Candidatus Dormibacteraeota bacterium]|nr:glycoside hydrolase family 15 protein [Candidatus Dormibacteraeota bacterium]